MRCSKPSRTKKRTEQDKDSQDSKDRDSKDNEVRDSMETKDNEDRDSKDNEDRDSKDKGSPHSHPPIPHRGETTGHRGIKRTGVGVLL